MNLKKQKLGVLSAALSLAACYGCATTAKESSPQTPAPAAQTQSAPRPSAAEQAAEQANVKKALDRFFHAVDVKDWNTVESVLASDFEFYSDDYTVLTRAEFIGAMKEDDMKIDKLELKDVRVSLSPDGQMAWAKYSAHLESSIKGEPYNMKSAETVAFRKEDGQWKLTHNHASVKKLDAKTASS